MGSEHPASGVEGDIEREVAGAKILVVDDDARNRAAAEAALADLHVPLTLVSSGREALRELLADDYALILLDVNMPVMDGFETARLIRSRDRNRSVPIILVTAFRHDEADIYQGYQLGAVDYLFKPVVPEVLRAKATFFLELRARNQQLARQAEQLHEAERIAAEQRLERERRLWEAERMEREVEEQRRINANLEAADRQKDEFIAMLAHELRNPLASVVTGLPLIKPPAGAADAARAWEAVRRQTYQLSRLLDDLLDASRVARGKITLQIELVDLREVIQTAVETCTPFIAQRNHSLSVSVPPQPVRVNGDPARLSQVVQNLLHNAARYTSPGGNIRVTLEQQRAGAVVRVADDGRGMPPDLLNRAFDRFVQARDGGGGLGLGLSLVRELVTLHGGQVEARSEGVDRGTEMVVRLPSDAEVDTSSASLLPPDESPEADKRHNGRAIHVVLVEDDEDIRDLTSALLETRGHVVECAATGSEGVELAMSAQPDVVVVDIGLPDIDGCEVARRICQRLGDARPALVALSGYGQERDRERSAAAGFDAHLLKPAQPDVLERTIAELVHRN